MNVLVDIANSSATRKLEYDGWSSRSRGVSLEDEHGNVYRMVSWGAGTRAIWRSPQGDFWEMQVRNDSVHPGKTLTDILVFEKPIAQAKTLTLKLPRSNFGGRGYVTLSIDLTRLAR